MVTGADEVPRRPPPDFSCRGKDIQPSWTTLTVSSRNASHQAQSFGRGKPRRHPLALFCTPRTVPATQPQPGGPR